MYRGPYLLGSPVILIFPLGRENADPLSQNRREGQGIKSYINMGPMANAAAPRCIGALLVVVCPVRSSQVCFVHFLLHGSDARYVLLPLRDFWCTFYLLFALFLQHPGYCVRVCFPQSLDDAQCRRVPILYVVSSQLFGAFFILFCSSRVRTKVSFFFFCISFIRCSLFVSVIFG